MFTLPISSPTVSFENSGGKGDKLARLITLGVNVPPGSIVTAGAYHLCVSANGLGQVIRELIGPSKPDDTAALESASAIFRKAFASGKMPEDIIQQMVDSEISRVRFTSNPLAGYRR